MATSSSHRSTGRGRRRGRKVNEGQSAFSPCRVDEAAARREAEATRAGLGDGPAGSNATVNAVVLVARGGGHCSFSFLHPLNPHRPAQPLTNSVEFPSPAFVSTITSPLAPPPPP